MNVLVLESDDEIRNALEYILEIEGYRVYSTRDVGEALHVVKDNKIDVAIVDRTSVNVEDVCKLSSNDKFKIIITSTGRLEEIQTYKYDHFIRKPFDLDKLLELIRS